VKCVISVFREFYVESVCINYVMIDSMYWKLESVKDEKLVYS